MILGVDGISDFNGLHSGKHNDEVQLYAFDVLASEGDDYRRAVFVDQAQACAVDFALVAEKAPPANPQHASFTDSLERRHEDRAFIQHGQNLVMALGRKHQDDPINAGVTVAF